MANENMLLFAKPSNNNLHRMTNYIAQASINMSTVASLRKSLLGIDPTLDINNILGLSPEELNRYLTNLLASATAVGQDPNSRTYKPPYEPFVFSFQNDGELYPGPARFYNKSDGSIESQRFVLPVPPSDVSISVPNSPQTISTISGLMYSHAGDIDLEEISFEGFFPHILNGINSDYNKWPPYVPPYVSLYGYRSPTRWVTELTTAMRANQPIRFAIFANDSDQVASSNGSCLIEPILMSVSSFQWSFGSATGGTRQDITYSLTLKKWRRQTISVVNRVRK